MRYLSQFFTLNAQLSFAYRKKNFYHKQYGRFFLNTKANGSNFANHADTPLHFLKREWNLRKDHETTICIISNRLKSIFFNFLIIFLIIIRFAQQQCFLNLISINQRHNLSVFQQHKPFRCLFFQ